MHERNTATIQETRLKEKMKREMGETVYRALLDPEVTELRLNEDHRVWVVRQGCNAEVLCTMSPSSSLALLGSVAHSLGLVANADNPVVEGEFYIDNSRFAGTLPPISAAPTFVIRKKALKIFTFADYVAAGIMSPFQKTFFEKAIVDKKNILVIGGTYSGKTTLVNAFIDAISTLCPNDRLVIIEDTNELQCKAEDSTIMRSNSNVSSSRLLKLTLRFTPDRILFGEVRGGEALELLKSWNTGHPGGLCTLHAKSAYGGLLRLEECISEISNADMSRFISEAVDVVVFIEKHGGSRRISEVLEVDGLNDGKYITRQIVENVKPHVVK